MLWMTVEDNITAKSRYLLFSFSVWNFIFFDFSFPLTQIFLNFFFLLFFEGNYSNEDLKHLLLN